MDRAGRFVLPKQVREALGLAPGDSLEIELHDAEITLRPCRSVRPMRKKHGIWVLDGGTPMRPEETENLLRRDREERDRDNLGDGQ